MDGWWNTVEREKERIERDVWGAKEGKYKGKKEKGRREKIEEKIECRRKRAGEEEGSDLAVR